MKGYKYKLIIFKFNCNLQFLSVSQHRHAFGTCLSRLNRLSHKPFSFQYLRSFLGNILVWSLFYRVAILDTKGISDANQTMIINNAEYLPAWSSRLQIEGVYTIIIYLFFINQMQKQTFI